MGIKRNLLVITSSVVFPFSAALAAPVVGTVTEAGTGKPIPGAQVSLIQPSSHGNAEIRYQEDTSVDGQFTVADAAPGKYSVAVTSAGYRAGARLDIDVASQPVTLNLSLDSK